MLVAGDRHRQVPGAPVAQKRGDGDQRKRDRDEPAGAQAADRRQPARGEQRDEQGGAMRLQGQGLHFGGKHDPIPVLQDRPSGAAARSKAARSVRYRARSKRVDVRVQALAGSSSRVSPSSLRTRSSMAL